MNIFEKLKLKAMLRNCNYELAATVLKQQFYDEEKSTELNRLIDALIENPNFDTAIKIIQYNELYVFYFTESCHDGLYVRKQPKHDGAGSAKRPVAGYDDSSAAGQPPEPFVEAQDPEAAHAASVEAAEEKAPPLASSSALIEERFAALEAVVARDPFGNALKQAEQTAWQDEETERVAEPYAEPYRDEKPSGRSPATSDADERPLDEPSEGVTVHEQPAARLQTSAETDGRSPVEASAEPRAAAKPLRRSSKHAERSAVHHPTDVPTDDPVREALPESAKEPPSAAREMTPQAASAERSRGHDGRHIEERKSAQQPPAKESFKDSIKESIKKLVREVSEDPEPRIQTAAAETAASLSIDASADRHEPIDPERSVYRNVVSTLMIDIEEMQRKREEYQQFIYNNDPNAVKYKRWIVALDEAIEEFTGAARILSRIRK